MKSFEPRIEWRDPNALTPYSNNAKTHPREQIDKIAASIAGFGFDQPIVIDADGVIIKGHGRREASLRLGLDKVPVLVRGDLSVAEIKAARIADNKTAESPWDDEMLRLELETLVSADFDISLTGFDLDEIDRLLQEIGCCRNLKKKAVPGSPKMTSFPRCRKNRCRSRAIFGSSETIASFAATPPCSAMSSV